MSSKIQTAIISTEKDAINAHKSQHSYLNSHNNPYLKNIKIKDLLRKSTRELRSYNNSPPKCGGYENDQFNFSNGSPRGTQDQFEKDEKDKNIEDSKQLQNLQLIYGYDVRADKIIQKIQDKKKSLNNVALYTSAPVEPQYSDASTKDASSRNGIKNSTVDHLNQEAFENLNKSKENDPKIAYSVFIPPQSDNDIRDGSMQSNIISNFSPKKKNSLSVQRRSIKFIQNQIDTTSNRSQNYNTNNFNNMNDKSREKVRSILKEQFKPNNGINKVSPIPNSAITIPLIQKDENYDNLNQIGAEIQIFTQYNGINNFGNISNNLQQQRQTPYQNINNSKETDSAYTTGINHKQSSHEDLRASNYLSGSIVVSHNQKRAVINPQIKRRQTLQGQVADIQVKSQYQMQSQSKSQVTTGRNLNNHQTIDIQKDDVKPTAYPQYNYRERSEKPLKSKIMSILSQADRDISKSQINLPKLTTNSNNAKLSMNHYIQDDSSDKCIGFKDIHIDRGLNKRHRKLTEISQDSNDDCRIDRDLLNQSRLEKNIEQKELKEEDQSQEDDEEDEIPIIKGSKFQSVIIDKPIKRGIQQHLDPKDITIASDRNVIKLKSNQIRKTSDLSTQNTGTLTSSNISRRNHHFVQENPTIANPNVSQSILKDSSASMCRLQDREIYPKYKFKSNDERFNQLMKIDWQRQFDELTDNLKHVKRKQRYVKELIEKPNEANQKHVKFQLPGINKYQK
ncbi:UNKNOWN [Stylonychia lemnae]|uniref:Uncharacterized protein n=1 Tax=Stylonychia lemnae TaxID=5949 RepID=A0A078A7N1_STYLE|nr:UNKNOWN [Stylonychia lemnae]|eukprot:CDW78249.1 UNKNOWN [Stylonychia lemnae]